MGGRRSPHDSADVCHALLSAAAIYARHFDTVSLDEAIGVPEAAMGPERRLEITEGFHRVLSAIRALPEPQREVGLLFYIKDYSHREIAAFLDVPVATVNNRLHGARQELRMRLCGVARLSRPPSVQGHCRRS